MKSDKDLRYISLQISKSEVQQLDNLAHQVDLSRSQIIRRLISLINTLPEAKNLPEKHKAI